MSQDTFQYRKVERHILELVEAGALAPGQKIPSIRELSRSLAVGVATVNHAYVELERKGVVEARPRSGFYVRGGERGSVLAVPDGSSGPPKPPRTANRSALIQTVLEALGDPALTPFGVVCADERLLPAKHLAKLLAARLRESPERALSYAPIAGDPSFRLQVAHYLMRSIPALTAGAPSAAEPALAPIHADDVVITNGGLEALYLSLRALTRTGDTVAIQSPTYFCFVQLVENLGLRAIELPSSPTSGVDPKDVAEVVRAYDLAACVLTPNFNNPDGALMAEEAKAEVVRLLNRANIPLVEDDIAGELYYGETRPNPALVYDQKGLVLHCSSFSKTLAPGFRVGYVVPGRSNPALREKILKVKATTNVCTPYALQSVLDDYLASGKLPAHLRKLRATIRSQTTALRNLVAEYFPEGTRVTRPEGGSVLWVELPGRVNTVELFYAAREEGIGLAPGPIFTVSNEANSFLRLSTSFYWTDRVVRDVERLGELARSMV